MVVAQDDYSILAFEFVPPVEYRKGLAGGCPIPDPQNQQEVEGAKSCRTGPVGWDQQRKDRRAALVRVTKSKASSPTWEPTLFLSPAQLEALEEDD